MMHTYTPPPSDSDDDLLQDESLPDTLEEHSPAELYPHQQDKRGFLSWITDTIRGKKDSSLRETIEEYIEENSDDTADGENTLSSQEKQLISNILKLRDTTVFDAMVPRADIYAIEVNTPQHEVLSLLSERQYSRIPVFKDKLDDFLGVLHIKDVLSTLAQNKPIVLQNLIREAPIISPSMSIPDLMVQMRHTRKQIAMVVDEFGGIDGLVTIGDVLEEIVGQIDDEHGTEEQPQMIASQDGSLIADARVEIEEFEDHYGSHLSEEEREESETLGGLIFHLAGRVPARGEVLSHVSGMSFEILVADPRRVSKIKIDNIPKHTDQ